MQRKSQGVRTVFINRFHAPESKSLANDFKEIEDFQKYRIK